MAWYDITGTVSDLIMAIAAVYAAINVKDLIKERTHTIGLKKAEGIVLSLDKFKDSIYKIIYPLTEFDLLLNGDDFSNHDLLLNNRNNLFKLRRDIEYLKKQYQEIKYGIDTIERWNVIIKNNNIIIPMLNNMIELLNSSDNAALNGISFLDEDKLNLVTRRSFSKSFKTNYNEALASHVNIESIYSEFSMIKFSSLFSIQNM